MVLNQEDKWMISIEKFGAFQLVGAKNADVNFISSRVPFQGRGVENVRQVEVLLACDVGQISFGFVHCFSQPKFFEVVLKGKKVQVRLRVSSFGRHVATLTSASFTCNW